jgi:hypothetical protein
MANPFENVNRFRGSLSSKRREFGGGSNRATPQETFIQTQARRQAEMSSDPQRS